MPNGSSDPVWTELGNIDYLLEQLARAVERGEVDRSNYDVLAPRYLERRAELVAILEARSVSATVARPEVSPSVSALGVPPSAQELSAPPRPSYATPREPIQVNWTGVLTAVGSLLVIVASAIFAIATWKSFSVGFRIGFLGLLTAGFYVAGNLVRTRLKLAAGGIALMVVGSAMLLFDGWIVIDGYALTGPWPWVGWLAVCSAVYWLTEVRVAGRFFGAIGAAAQIAWVWLLGQGMGWTTGPRMAGIAVVALAWTLAGRLAEKREPLVSLAWVMRLAGPIVVGFAAIGVAVDLGIGPVGWTQIVAALVVGTCATIIADLVELPSGIAAVTHVPAFFAIASMVDFSGAEWGHAIVLALMAIAYLVHEVVRGGWGHGVLALFAEAGVWWVLALHYEWSPDVTLAVLSALAVSWLLAATLIERSEDIAWRGTKSTQFLTLGGGYALLLASTLSVPLVRMAVPLAGTQIVQRDVKLAVLVTALWWAVSAFRTESGPGVPALAGLFYSVAALAAWQVPGWHSALYASVLLAVVGGVLAARGPLARILKLPEAGIAFAMRFLAAALLFGGVAASDSFFDLRAWQVPVLVGLSAAFWMLDAVLAEESRIGLAGSSALAVVAVALLVWWRTAPGHGGGQAAIAGAGAALVLSGSALLSRRAKGWFGAWPFGAAVAGTVCCVTAADDPGRLAIALAVAALAWIPVALLVSAEASAASGLLGMLAVFAALAHFDGLAWVTVAVVLVVSGLVLTPSFVRLGGLTDRALRTVRALAVAGLSGPLLLILVGTPDVMGLGVGRWAQIGEQGMVASLLGLGAYAVVAGLIYRFEPAVYGGGIAFVAAIWAELGAVDIGQVAAFTTPLALYLIWAGARWSKHTGQPPNPAFDFAAAFVGLIAPSLAAVSGGFAGAAVSELMWALGLALVAIAAGVVLKVRAYFFGGSLALVFVAVGRSWVYLVELWWLVLGLIGIAMLAIAIAWARQQMLPGDARERVSETLEGWR